MKRTLIITLLAISMTTCASNVVSLGGESYRITKLPTKEHIDEKSLQDLILAEAVSHCQQIKLNSSVHTHRWSSTISSDFSADSEDKLQRVELEFRCRINT